MREMEMATWPRRALFLLKRLGGNASLRRRAGRFSLASKQWYVFAV